MIKDNESFLDIIDPDIKVLYSKNTAAQIIKSTSNLLANSDRNRQIELFSDTAFTNIVKQALSGLDQRWEWGFDLIADNLLIDPKDHLLKLI